jgi:proline racemase
MSNDGMASSSSPSDIPFTIPERLFSSSAADMLKFKCIDCHAGGEPARVVLSGFADKIPVDCKTALQKRAYMMEHLDHYRKILLLEPRGYPCQNANFIFQDKETGKIQYVIAEQNKIYPLMSGHNTICVATALLECGVVEMQEPMTRFTMEAPAGPIAITAKCNNGKAVSITLKNAPSFVEKTNVTVNVPHVGPVVCDIAYGGMWYAVVELEQFKGESYKDTKLNMELTPENGAALCRTGEMIKVACREQFPVQHPDPTIDYPGVDILVFREKATRDEDNNTVHARNTVPMSNNVLDWDKPETWTSMLDRSPCGTGTCAVIAVMHAKGELKMGETFAHESIVGSIFTGTIVEETTVSGRSAIVPQVEGSACITQYSEVVVDSHDPFQEGYKVGDIW